MVICPHRICLFLSLAIFPGYRVAHLPDLPALVAGRPTCQQRSRDELLAALLLATQAIHREIARRNLLFVHQRSSDVKNGDFLRHLSLADNGLTSITSQKPLPTRLYPSLS